MLIGHIVDPIDKGEAKEITDFRFQKFGINLNLVRFRMSHLLDQTGR